jgi:hypothetical protein
MRKRTIAALLGLALSSCGSETSRGEPGLPDAVAARDSARADGQDGTADRASRALVDAGCKPSCAGRACGDDGCGGSCGSCPAGQSCGSSGACHAPTFIRGLYLQTTSYWNGTSVKLTSADLKAIKQAGITDVYAQVRFASTGKDGYRFTLKPIVQFFKGSGIRVHAWTCPSNYNPTDNGPDSINRKVLDGVTDIYLNSYGADGVCLDEFYFGGTAGSHPNATQYVTDFHKKVFAIVKAHGGIATTCTTPEHGVAKSVYGVDYAAIGQHCDYMTPMAYTDDFAGGKAAWVGQVVAAIQAKTSAKVFPVLETYRGDKNPGTLKTVTALNAEITSGVSAGAKGYALFRFGLLSGWPTAGP